MKFNWIMFQEENFEMITYQTTKTIKDLDLRPLYEAVGWKSYTERVTDLSALVANAQLVLSAWDNEKLVGLIRTVGDGISIQYVQDILVLPDYQNKGIGSELLKKIIEKSKDIRQFVLITDGSDENKVAIEFYQKNGLKTFADTGICGMWRMA